MRRSRVQVKPIIGAATAKKEEAPRVDPPTHSEPTPEVPTIVVSEPSSSHETRQEPVSTVPTITIPNDGFKSPILPSDIPSTSQASPVRLDREKISPVPHPSRVRLLSTSSTISTVSKREKKRFTGEEPLDPKTMRMVDLITWNPRKENKLDRSKFDNNESQSDVEKNDDRPAAPQLKLDAMGKLVVDETSLVLDERATQSVWNIVDDAGGYRRKLHSFGRFKRGLLWTEKETDLFYEVLQATGPDFGLMHEFFPRRARNELKNKYNREEKLNWERLRSVLSRPVLLDTSLLERANAVCEEIRKEEQEKKDERMRKKKRRTGENEAEPCVSDEEWCEETADLEEEAAMILNELVEIDRRKEAILAEKKRKRTKKTKEGTSGTKEPRKPISKQASELLKETLAEVNKMQSTCMERTGDKGEEQSTLSGYPEETDGSEGKKKKKGEESREGEKEKEGQEKAREGKQTVPLGTARKKRIHKPIIK